MLIKNLVLTIIVVIEAVILKIIWEIVYSQYIFWETDHLNPI